MSRALDDLDPVFRPYAMALLARCVEAGILVAIVNTRRTAAEQAANVAKGVSWVAHSKHQDGLAIDVAPYAVWAEHGENKLNWDAEDPVWWRIGQIGESLGLRWGGRFSQVDPGHLEYVTPKPTEAA
jgi:peptidoglycan L-alanyl-D-glutamate endopeptidase CwlK